MAILLLETAAGSQSILLVQLLAVSFVSKQKAVVEVLLVCERKETRLGCDGDNYNEDS